MISARFPVTRTPAVAPNVMVATSSALGTAAALETFRRARDANAVTGYRERVADLEDFLGYKDYAERAKRLARP